jgi:hypothetical protein
VKQDLYNGKGIIDENVLNNIPDANGNERLK